MKYESCIIFLIAFISIPNMIGCTQKSSESCPSFPIKEDHTIVTGEGGAVKLHLPQWVSIEPTPDCKQVRSVNMQFWWHDKKLYPANQPYTFLSGNKFNRIQISIGGFYTKEEWRKIIATRIKPWQLEHPIAHKTLPLELYPQYHWTSPTQPKEQAVDGYEWGIRNTKDPITDRPYFANCNIKPTNATQPSLLTEGDFDRFGDAKCMGGITITKYNKAIAASIYVWADAAPEIDLIYNATIQIISNYIQEE